MIKLCSDQYCIKIDNTNNSWCKCWLIIDNNTTYLGAESLRYLKDHLINGLDNSLKKSSGHLHGYDFSWVLSLSEVHTVFYITADGQDKILLLQDVNAIEVCMIRLSQDQCLQWLNQIQAI